MDITESRLHVTHSDAKLRNVNLKILNLETRQIRHTFLFTMKQKKIVLNLKRNFFKAFQIFFTSVECGLLNVKSDVFHFTLKYNLKCPHSACCPYVSH